MSASRIPDIEAFEVQAATRYPRPASLCGRSGGWNTSDIFLGGGKTSVKADLHNIRSEWGFRPKADLHDNRSEWQRRAQTD
jgi:hypothetical protein